MNNEDRESKRRANHGNNDADVVGLSLTQAVRYLHMDEAKQSAEVGQSRRRQSAHENNYNSGNQDDVIRRFREVLWFWIKYYTHRGRDWLSLEFSSHLRFQEWNDVISLLI